MLYRLLGVVKIMYNEGKKREIGYYWVKLDGEWEIDEWTHLGWKSDNHDTAYSCIDESKLVRK